MLQNILFAAAFAVFLWLGTTPVQQKPGKTNDWPPQAIVFLLLGGFLLRLFIGISSSGYTVDVNTFKAWAGLVYTTPFKDVYDTAGFLDYPPGYLYVLWLAEALRRLFGFDFNSGAATLLIKLPSVIADIACAWALYALARPKTNERTACFAAAAWLLCPAVLINSAVWGQADSFCSMLLLFSLLCMLKNKYGPAAVLFGAVLLCKPQMLAFIPLYVFYPLRQKQYKQLGLGIAVVLFTGLLIATPFTKGFDYLWLVQKYASTMGYYNYFTINAYNIYGLFGLNWGSLEGLDLISNVLTLLSCGGAVALAGGIILRSKREDSVFAAAAVLMATVFLFCPKMHERYLFPALLFLWLCCVLTEDRRLQLAFGSFATLHFLNVSFVLYLNNSYISPTAWPLVLLSLGHVLAYGWLLYAVYRVFLKNDIHAAKTVSAPAVSSAKNAARPTLLSVGIPAAARMGRVDYLLVGAVTVLFALLSFTGLGSTKMATTVWEGQWNQEVIFKMSGKTDSIRYVPGIAAHGSSRTTSGVNFTVYTSIDSVNWVEAGTANDTTIFSWNQLDIPQAQGAWLKIVVNDQTVLNELAAKAKGEDRFLSLELLSGSGENLIDEQEIVPLYRTVYNSAYFDEIYHPRTAYEHVLGSEPYENTHPTLGKLLMSLGIRLFGMNPFGWRCMGALCGVLMLPVLYHLLWQLFTKTKYALFGTLVFALDFMHFTQTRVGTIDTYAVFFILLMFDAMVAFVKKDFTRPIKELLPPLALAGIFTGLGAAAKWTGLYAALGLAVLYFGKLLYEWKRAEKKQRTAVLHKSFTLCLWCCLFFVAVPFAIYFAAFLPITLLPHNAHNVWGAFWDYQKHMLSYHAGLQATHYFASPWYEWPLVWRPIWYFSNTNMTADGLAGTLSCLGSPLLWWSGAAAMLYTLFRALRERNFTAQITAVGFLAALLPWVGVARLTFIYHYFAAVPFLCIAVAMVFHKLEDRPLPRLCVGKWSLSFTDAAMGVFVLAMGVLFILFWPIISGAPAALSYINALEWLPEWYFS